MNREYRVVVLGSSGVGKSALTLQFVQNVFVERYDPTIEDSYRKELNDQGISLEILDTAGSEQFASMRDLYIRNGDGFMLVFSQTNPDSVEDLSPLISQIIKLKGAEAAILLVANKKDLCVSVDILNTGIVLSNKWNYPLVETSAKNKKSVEKAFDEVIKLIGNKKKLPDPEIKENKKRKKPKCKIM